MFYLSRSMTGDNLTRFHIEAGIAACHANAATYEETNWQAIHTYYQDLMTLHPSPVIAMNKAVALGLGGNLPQAIRDLKKLASDDQLKQYHLYHASLAELYRRSEKYKKSLKCYELALAATDIATERRFIEKRISQVRKFL